MQVSCAVQNCVVVLNLVLCCLTDLNFGNSENFSAFPIKGICHRTESMYLTIIRANYMPILKTLVITKSYLRFWLSITTDMHFLHILFMV